MHATKQITLVRLAEERCQGAMLLRVVRKKRVAAANPKNAMVMKYSVTIPSRPTSCAVGTNVCGNCMAKGTNFPDASTTHAKCTGNLPYCHLQIDPA